MDNLFSVEIRHALVLSIRESKMAISVASANGTPAAAIPAIKGVRAIIQLHNEGFNANAHSGDYF